MCGDEVKSQEAEVLHASFIHSDSLVTLWTPTKILVKLTKQDNLLYSEKQQIDFALQLIRNTQDFEQGLSCWNNKPDAEKTWTNLMDHFCNEKEKLKEIRGPTMVHLVTKICNAINGSH